MREGSKFSLQRSFRGVRADGNSGFLQDLEAGYNISLDEDQGPGEFTLPSVTFISINKKQKQIQ